MRTQAVFLPVSSLDSKSRKHSHGGMVFQTPTGIGGRFTRPLLDKLLWRKRKLSRDDQQSLIDMMKTCGVCFVHRRHADPDETDCNRATTYPSS